MSSEKVFSILPASSKEKTSEWQLALDVAVESKNIPRERALALEKFTKRIDAYKWPPEEFTVNGEPLNRELLDKIKHDVYFQALENELQELDNLEDNERISCIKRIKSYKEKGDLQDDDLRRVRFVSGREERIGMTEDELDEKYIETGVDMLRRKSKIFFGLKRYFKGEETPLTSIDELFLLGAECLKLYGEIKSLAEKQSINNKKIELWKEVLHQNVIFDMSEADFLNSVEEIGVLRIRLYFKNSMNEKDQEKAALKTLSIAQETGAALGLDIKDLGLSSENINLLARLAKIDTPLGKSADILRRVIRRNSETSA